MNAWEAKVYLAKIVVGGLGCGVLMHILSGKSLQPDERMEVKLDSSKQWTKEEWDDLQQSVYRYRLLHPDGRFKHLYKRETTYFIDHMGKWRRPNQFSHYGTWLKGVFTHSFKQLSHKPDS